MALAVRLSGGSELAAAVAPDPPSPPSTCARPLALIRLPPSHAILQVRLCLAKKDFIRAQILARKISPRAFQKQQGDSTGEIGIEGTAIEEADKV